MHSHWIDPTEPLALTVLKEADGVVITSATLKDRPPEAPEDWTNAEMRTGAVHLPYPVRRVSYDSPFDYRKASRIIVVNDVNREDMDQLAAAYRAKHGSAPEDLKRAMAHISVKSHDNGARNPKAHLRNKITLPDDAPAVKIEARSARLAAS